MTTPDREAAARTSPDDAGPWLVALDIDGTLVTYDEELRDATRDAVAAVRAAGHHVVLASGRSLIAMTPLAAELKIDDGWIVASNGAVVARLDPGAPEGYELEHVATFDPGPALRLLREELPDARYAVEDVGIGFRLTEHFPDGELQGQHEIVDFEELWSADVTRVVVRAPGSSSEDFHRMAEAVGLEDVTYAVGWSAWMDIAPMGVTKASGLERVREELGVSPRRTMAVGDGANDIDMLRWAARGVAMGHSSEQVRDAADEVTGGIDDEGVVRVLRELLDTRP
ncbi:HAD family hydrolase [Myceligenerans indicum]|uniref:HAD family phosphatase n=1 Tax=Myceligenerans indicum TaxID=2593663 RepID=A0ABS1LMD6_9MICO|nr:HAD family hydrolase [Myceligenerans indicum]MBL0887299.1 HAD family phosphatase [Myceligenerans indicum]